MTTPLESDKCPDCGSERKPMTDCGSDPADVPWVRKTTLQCFARQLATATEKLSAAEAKNAELESALAAAQGEIVRLRDNERERWASATKKLGILAPCDRTEADYKNWSPAPDDGESHA